MKVFCDFYSITEDTLIGHYGNQKNDQDQQILYCLFFLYLLSYLLQQ